MPRNPLQAQIQIGRKQLGMEDDDYRSLLRRAIGKESSAGISDAERKRVLEAMRARGFAARPAEGLRRRPSSKAHVRTIFAIWGSLKRKGVWRSPERSSLIAFVREMTGKGDPEWLTAREATPVIEALKAMERRGR